MEGRREVEGRRGQKGGGGRREERVDFAHGQWSKLPILTI